MYTRRKIRWSIVARLSIRHLVLFALWASSLVLLYQLLKPHGIDISVPMTPLNTIGVAVAFYIGFKNNQSYDRYWEARKIWGGIVNVSRTWANQTLTYISADNTHSPLQPDEATVISAREIAEEQRVLIYRHLAWINALRFQLRRKTPFSLKAEGPIAQYMQTTDVGAMRAELARFLSDDELTVACDQVNTATQLMRLQGKHLRRLSEQDRLVDPFRLVHLMESITENYTLQGKCERIKNTPFPRQYAHFSDVFTWLFVLLLPLGIINEFAKTETMHIWLAVPLTMLISWIFRTMEVVGDTSEDPFENFINDVPMTALCRTIEIDLRQMLGETDLPPKLEPTNDVLM